MGNYIFRRFGDRNFLLLIVVNDIKGVISYKDGRELGSTFQVNINSSTFFDSRDVSVAGFSNGNFIIISGSNKTRSRITNKYNYSYYEIQHLVETFGTGNYIILSLLSKANTLLSGIHGKLFDINDTQITEFLVEADNSDNKVLIKIKVMQDNDF